MHHNPKVQYSDLWANGYSFSFLGIPYLLKVNQTIALELLLLFASKL